MINLPNVDGKIWNLPFKIIDMIDEYQKHKRLDISLNSEGPDSRCLGLFQILDELGNKLGWDKSKITVFTNNLLETHDEYVIRKNGPLYLDSVQEFARLNTIPTKDFDNLLHFGIFIGRSNWLRLWISSAIFNEFRNKSILTFHFNSKIDYHKDHLGIDDLILFLGQDSDVIKNAQYLISKSPILIDKDIPKYPIITPSHYEISKIYHKFFVEVVCETYCQGNTFYPTEKIWRPIVLKTPFIIQGPKNYYHNLRKMGFKTFSNWWDEGFTNDDYTHQPKEIFKILNQLSKLTVKELEGLYIDMQSTVDHNYDLLMTLTSTDFVKAFR